VEKTQNQWVCSMARSLVCEITEQMAGIQLSQEQDPKCAVLRTPMHGVCALIGGDYTLDMHFFAEKDLFERLARNMLGEEPSEEDVQDYAMEFFNTLCGRFISEIINETHVKIRLTPIRYELPSGWKRLGEDEAMYTMIFVSDKQEYAAFSWTSKPIEEIMRRNLSK